jgi:tetratricopeptide (TPR) repeat protein
MAASEEALRIQVARSTRIVKWATIRQVRASRSCRDRDGLPHFASRLSTVEIPMIRFLASLAVALLLVGCNQAAALQCANADIDPDAGVEACTRLIELDDQDAASRTSWLVNRGQHHLRAGRTEPALRDLARAIELSPKDANAVLVRGIAYGTAGRLDEALRDFDRAVALAPDLFAGHMNRAKVLSDTGRFRESLIAYDRAIALEPDAWMPRDGRCWVRAVLAEDLDGARADCDLAIAKAPLEGNPRNNRGLVNYRMGRHQAAIDDYTASIALAPEVASSYYVRGLARRALGQTGAADDDMRKALSIEAGVVERYAGYGVIAPH